MSPVGSNLLSASRLLHIVPAWGDQPSDLRSDRFSLSRATPLQKGLSPGDIYAKNKAIVNSNTWLTSTTTPELVAGDIYAKIKKKVIVIPG